MLIQIKYPTVISKAWLNNGDSSLTDTKEDLSRRCRKLVLQSESPDISKSLIVSLICLPLGAPRDHLQLVGFWSGVEGYPGDEIFTGPSSSPMANTPPHNPTQLIYSTVISTQPMCIWYRQDCSKLRKGCNYLAS